MLGIRKLGTVQDHLVEVSPFEYGNELLIFESVRPRTPDNTHGGNHYLRIRRLHDGTRDVRSAEEFAACEVLTEFGEGFTFGVPFVWDSSVYVYATLADKPEVDDIHLFRTTDMKAWEESIALRGENERLYNCTVCRAGDRFVMAYETNDERWPAFTIKFAESNDLMNWTKIPVGTAIHGSDRYCACPSMRWLDGWFYIYCLEMPRAKTLGGSHTDPGWYFEEFAAKSQDLLHWEMGAGNPILAPESDGSENINTSDIDFCEFDGKVIIYYSWGSQTGDEHLAHAVFDGSLEEFLRASCP